MLEAEKLLEPRKNKSRKQRRKMYHKDKRQAEYDKDEQQAAAWHCP